MCKRKPLSEGMAELWSGGGFALWSQQRSALRDSVEEGDKAGQLRGDPNLSVIGERRFLSFLQISIITDFTVSSISLMLL